MPVVYIRVNPEDKKKPGVKPTFLDETTKNEIYNLYWISRLTFKQISKKMGISYRRVRDTINSMPKPSDDLNSSE
ncbi:hypothetical protein OAG24_01170 [bacterium]|nr:hypothetical protein [bacterium]